MVDLLHPVKNSKPQIYAVDVRRQGGSMHAYCECGYYCMHNHKDGGQARLCVARHVLDIKNIDDMKPKELLAQWESPEAPDEE